MWIAGIWYKKYEAVKIKCLVVVFVLVYRSMISPWGMITFSRSFS